MRPLMNWRSKAWELAQQRSRRTEPFTSTRYGQFSFDLKEMEPYLTEQSFQTLKSAIEEGSRIDRNLADQVANAMKNWAQKIGATHWSHWFQPLSGIAAEKQESFFNLSAGESIAQFNGSALTQQEPDASTFPTGGLRSTFEARGITAWDPTSPAFILDRHGAKTLYIPTIFVSYQGQSLDFKAPFLKSAQFIGDHAHQVAAYFDRFATKAFCQLGCEQEFYLIDEAFFYARADIRFVGRCLFGNSSKVLDTKFNYFGAIPERVHGFLVELEAECHRVGVPLRIRHNEEGPSQFEVVPAHEEGNVAIDHNILLMELMHRVAAQHHLKVLLSEKPFQKFTGSGKHCNWSLHTDTGKNLLAPADTPRKNLSFLTFFVNCLKAFRDHAPLIRASVASLSNDLRLGRDGAPPFSISVFIGKRLREVLDDIEQRGTDWIMDEDLKAALKLDIHQKIPELLVENTDLNRISPIAFTGNKFEFRQLGASQHPASLITIINTIVGDQLRQFREQVDLLIKKEKLKKDTAILRELQQLIPLVKPILYEGDNYSDAWKQSMETHGLLLAENTPEALKAFVSTAALDLFESSKVFDRSELDARIDYQMERYSDGLQRSVALLKELAQAQIVPAAWKHLKNLSDQMAAYQAAGLSDTNHDPKHFQEDCTQLQELIEKMSESLAADPLGKVQEHINRVAEQIARLEAQIPDDLWPLPKLQEILWMP
ncbi:MAG: glutamine synthetase III [Bacteroidota bacterium]